MGAKAIEYNTGSDQNPAPLQAHLVSDDLVPSLMEFGQEIAKATGTRVSVLAEDRIRLSTPQALNPRQLHQLRSFITNSLHLPVTLLLEPNFVEIVAI